ncbi:class I SAM-dependent methyltransferase [Clostridium boliviensis]|uniref:Class I SAM-dependent methyltransferase n=1 Tax=Clostridium boliviensis TaxID=318465 RepID=A0ABU4GN66_9CLOT|nr:class I SAM-dependent methyltransferase [Clostridium boliviensis]MDW2798450.1 class I SAM-dependent methyltransferase [Clostridium boliviensis]
MERMEDFFASRVNGYEEHMLSAVEGCKQAYALLPSLLPASCSNLLDLGCGTGLELKQIFKKFPDLFVTGIDLTREMLDKLKYNFPEKNINLICGSYFDVDLKKKEYDCAVSFQTMHHFEHKAKIGLYQKIFRALTDQGLYIECDYMVEDQGEEDYYFSENRRIRHELGISKGEFYHYDTPCTISNQIAMLKKGGFERVELILRISNTTILAAYKQTRQKEE